jgi:hypothetical protein
MNERSKSHRESISGLGGLGSIFTDTQETAPMVTVASGPYAEALPVGNMTVGEIRRRFRDRFDIDPRAHAVVNGNDVDDQTVVRSGEMLYFTTRAGEKGVGAAELRELFSLTTASVAKPLDRITIEGREVTATSPEGKTASMPLQEFAAQMAPRRMDTGGVILPSGVVGMRSEGPITVWVHQTPPSVYRFKWIARDSPAPFGSEAKYRTVRLALPYLLVFVVFTGEPGALTLSKNNECFFRNDSLESEDDELFYPALLNCSKIALPDGGHRCWICTQHLARSQFEREKNTGKRLRGAFKELMRCLLETGFNLSSEVHEGTSFFTESKSCDPRIATVEEWEQATSQDPLFVLEVPWLRTGLNVRQMIDRIIQYHRLGRSPASSASLAKIVYAHPKAN